MCHFVTVRKTNRGTNVAEKKGNQHLVSRKTTEKGTVISGCSNEDKIKGKQFIIR